ncbi:MAG: type III pantothenate kinase [Clostridiales bacterium]|nr:type III pantothenate kinase [Clostridiales bacterium]
MILALDVGNSNIVIGCIDDGKIIFDGRLTTNHSKTDMEFAVMLKNILTINKIDVNSFEGAIISSVVPPIDKALRKAVELVIGKQPITLDGCEGLKVDLDDPSQLGNDLVVGAVTVLNEFPPPIILIDMGTATTIFVIDKSGTYIGGAIMPGIMISQHALSKETSLLPSISLEAPKSVIGKNTIDAMQSGAILGNASMIDGMIDKIEAELGEKTTVVATGGLSKSIIENCNHDIIYDADLLLRGLWIIYKRHTEK